MERANSSVVHVRRKKARLSDPHVAPLVQLADGIGRIRGLRPGAVPYPDPDHGGVGAQVLFVLTSPGPGARKDSGSGLLSLENDDEGAARCHRELSRVGLTWSEVVHWNIVPFPVRNDRGPTGTEVRDGAYWMPPLLSLLHHLRVVVLLGRQPEIAWVESDLGWPGLTVVTGPSPGPRGMIQPGAHERLRSAFSDAAAALRAS